LFFRSGNGFAIILTSRSSILPAIVVLVFLFHGVTQQVFAVAMPCRDCRWWVEVEVSPKGGTDAKFKCRQGKRRPTSRVISSSELEPRERQKVNRKVYRNWNNLHPEQSLVRFIACTQRRYKPFTITLLISTSLDSQYHQKNASPTRLVYFQHLASIRTRHSSSPPIW
jgi:hypothetical protein